MAAFTLTVKRYPLDSHGNRGSPTILYSVQANAGQYFDMYIDYPGAGSWAYTTELTDTTTDSSGTVSMRSIVILVAKR